jgi:hypothetical protein
MALDDDSRQRSASLAVIIGLVIICIGVGSMMFITIDAASSAKDPSARKLLARLSWMSLVLLCLAMLMTVWVVLRHVRNRLRNDLSKPSEPTPYVNAWELAGKRFQLNEDNEPEDPDYLPDTEEGPDEGGLDGEEDQDGEDGEGDEPSQGPGDRWR